MNSHLVFYDGTCGFCDQIVQILLKIDKKQRFTFAPLQGKTAKSYLKNIPTNTDSLVLIENYQSSDCHYYFYGKAALRILWLLGLPWSILGTFSFLPSFLYDWIYRIIARNRLKIFGSSCTIVSEENKHRFLP